MTVDVFIPACQEPIEMVSKILGAAKALRGAHRTWLLDDGHDDTLKQLAHTLQVGYITRTDRSNAKAGNINHALGCTDGDIIAVFDIDHIPSPEYLERTVGYFSDPRVGFVQTLITFNPKPGFWIAQAACETSYDFYNPTSMGMDAIGGASMMGTNSLVRRSALLACEGYQSGLAEDLATSLALHARGWQSVYVAEALAPGLTPLTIAAWFNQQLKWGRGVFEVWLTHFPRACRSLTWSQRVCYTVRMTKYHIGFVFMAHLVATLVILTVGTPAARADYQQYLLFATPLAVCDILIRQLALGIWRHSTLRSTSVGRAVALVFFSWPIYTLAWLMAVLRIPLAFRNTPKGDDDSIPISWVLPQILTSGLLLYGVFSFPWASQQQVWLLIGFALIQSGLQIIVLCQRLRPARILGMIAAAQQKRLANQIVAGTTSQPPSCNR
jgi:cellulose synthase/poly-beta-1,6-N-acetylglucosamine synthase-like glycosyltransferase